MTKLISMYEHDDRPELSYPGGRTELMECDVAVIGGGAAGLAAAVRAAQGGKKVVILEKMDRFGGNSWYAGGLLSTTSKYQRALGMEDKTDIRCRDMMRINRYTLDPRLIWRFVSNTGTCFEWLADMGLDMDNIRYAMDSVVMIKDRKDPGPLNNPGYGPGLMGSTVVSLLAGQLDDLGVQVLLSTKAKELLTDETGAICGLIADGQDKRVYISTNTVVLASGGFGCNTEMLRRFLPRHFSSDNYVSHYCMLFSTGDGIRMAESIGAEVGKNVCVGMYLAHNPGTFSVQGTFRNPITMIVNRDGQRFIAEDYTGDEEDGDSEYILDMQKEGLAYTLFDEPIKLLLQKAAEEKCRLGDPVPSLEQFQADLEQEAREGKTAISDTIEGLAPFIGCDPDVLCRTVEHYNDMCRQGQDTDLFKQKEYLHPLCQPPFYAVRIQRNFDVTMGGVSIDWRFRALRPDQSIIPGLYVAGDVASNWMGETYGPLFSSFAWALNSGYMAAEEILLPDEADIALGG